MENEKQLTNESGVNEENYASMLSEAINSKDAEIRALKEAQARTVKDLTDKIVNGQFESEQPVVEKADIAALRKDLFNTDNNNLQYVEKALKLRSALIEDGQPDPFLPYGNKIAPNEDDFKAAEKVAKVLQECVDYAEGDSQLFTNELQRRTIDVAPRKK